MGKKWFVFIVFASTISASGCRKEKENIYPEGDKTEIFLTPITGPGQSVLLILNESGDTVMYKNTGTQVTDFKRCKINGKTYYSYFSQNKDFYAIPLVPSSAGYRIITDSNLNELHKLTLISHEGINAASQPGLENHDFLMLAENHFITLAYYEKTVTNIPADLNPAPGIKVATPVIQEVLNGKVVWQWVGSDYPELYETSIESNDYGDNTKAADYLHVNSMWTDARDGNLIISCRNSNQVIKLNRHGKGIVWQLGGINSDFEIPVGVQFLRQHNASLVNEGRTLMLLDNGDINERNYSRIVEFDLDETARKILAARSYNIPGDLVRFGGSVQKFGERYFVGGGSGGFIMEFNPKTGIKTFEKDLGLGSYRAFKYTSSLQP